MAAAATAAAEQNGVWYGACTSPLLPAFGCVLLRPHSCSIMCVVRWHVCCKQHMSHLNLLVISHGRVSFTNHDYDGTPLQTTCMLPKAMAAVACATRCLNMLPPGSCNKLLHAASLQVSQQVLLHHPPATCVPWYTWGAVVCKAQSSKSTAETRQL
jgi:hypothetical protein